MNKKRKKKKLDRFWSGSGKFFLVLLIFYLLYFAVSKIIEAEQEKKYLFKRDEIEVSGNEIVSTSKIIRICGFIKNDIDEVEIDPDRVAEELMSLNYIKGVSIVHSPPRMLKITLEERRPIAFIYGLGLNLIDHEGVLMPVPRNKMTWNLPIINGISESLGKLGEKTTASSAYRALQLITYLEKENPLLLGFISEINLDNKNHLRLRLIKGGTIIRINKDTFPRELFVLKNYLVNYADWSELHKIEYIDLRFNNQLVIKFKA
jgi:cell division septal protein FtsQ